MKSVLRVALLFGLVLMVFVLACNRSGPGPKTAGPKPGALTFIDVHDHLIPEFRNRGGGSGDPYDSSGRMSRTHMDDIGMSHAILMPTPFAENLPGEFRLSDLAKVVQRYPERYSLMAGGESLNPMIHRAVKDGAVSPELEKQFRAAAEEILAQGAIGFGEMAALHLSTFPGHPYEAAPPDHPLFMLLAEIAAARGVPIDLHMEAVPEDMPVPDHFAKSPNPATLKGTIAPFERLLAHRPQAVFIWDHIGWDLTGKRDIGLMTRLFERHSNLYMSFKIHRTGPPPTKPVDESGRLKPEWLPFIQAHKDRLLMGGDFKYGLGRDRTGVDMLDNTLRTFFDQLPPDLAKTIGQDNPRRVYRLPKGV